MTLHDMKRNLRKKQPTHPQILPHAHKHYPQDIDDNETLAFAYDWMEDALERQSSGGVSIFGSVVSWGLLLGVAVAQGL